MLGRVVAALALVAVSCGGPNPAESQRVLRVLMSDDWAATPPVVDAVREFERQHLGVRVQMDDLPFAQIIDAVHAGVDAGDPHDVVQWHAFAVAARNLAEPLDDLWAEHLDEREFVARGEDVRWGDVRYGVPLDINAMVLMANVDELAAHGIEIGAGPRTFADLEEVARAVTTADRSKRGIALPHSSWRTYGWIRANGGEVVSIAEDGRPTYTLDDPRVVEALDFLGRLVGEELAFPPVGRDLSLDAFALYQAGSVALHASGAWDAVRIEEAGVPWRQEVMLLPAGVRGESSGSALGGSSMLVPRGSPNRELAFEFMLHLISDEYALRYAKEHGRLPVRDRVFEDPFFDTPALRVALEQLRTAHPMRLIAFPEADQAFSDAIVEVLTGRADAATALGRAQQRAEASLSPEP